MRLKQYCEFWSIVSDSNLYKIDEVLDVDAKVKKVSDREWYFWISNDLYVVKIFPKSKDYYHLSFTYNDPTGSDIASITNKHTPFNVMNGVATVMKEIIEVLNPRVIEFYVFAEKKKIDMFRKVAKYILRKHKDVFGNYSLKEGVVNMPYDMPDGNEKLKGTEFRLERIK